MFHTPARNVEKCFIPRHEFFRAGARSNNEQPLRSKAYSPFSRRSDNQFRIHIVRFRLLFKSGIIAALQPKMVMARSCCLRCLCVRVIVSTAAPNQKISNKSTPFSVIVLYAKIKESRTSTGIFVNPSYD